MTSQRSHRSARRKVMMTALLESPGRPPRKFRIANLSPGGALLLGQELPSTGSLVRFHCGRISAEGRVAWSDAGSAGVAFHTNIEPQQALPAKTDTSTLIVTDDRECNFRRPGFRGNQLSAEEREILVEWRRSDSAV